MHKSMDAFSRCIDPVSADRFLRDYWEQDSLLIERNDPEYFADLLSTRDIDRLFSATDLRFPSFRMIQHDRTIPVQSYTTNKAKVYFGEFTGLADLNKVYKLYEAGATIVLEELQRNWEPLVVFCKYLEHFFTFPITANAYLTPRNSKGFAAHIDAHNVLILQIEGTKRWKIYDRPVPVPMPKHREENPLDDRKCAKEFVLTAGSTLYLPRGFFHEAQAEDVHSLHVTIGIKQVTYFDALQELLVNALAETQDHVAARQSLPVGFANDHAQTAEEINHATREIIHILESKLDPQHASSLIVRRFVDDILSRNRGQLCNLNDVAGVDINSTMFRRDDIVFYIEDADGKVSLAFCGKKVQFSSSAREFVAYVTQAASFRPADVPTDNLSDSEKLDLTKKLVAEGFLTLYDESVDR